MQSARLPLQTLHFQEIAMKILSAFFLAALSASGLSTHAKAQLSCDTPLFATGFDRDVTHGTKAALIDAVSQGEPLRIGWQLDFDDDGASDLTHWADAAFLSIFEGEVFTQVDAIQRQSPRRGDANVTLREPYIEWRGSLGTTGVMEGRFSDGTAFPSDLKVSTMWCSTLDMPAKPVLLYRNGTNGEDISGSKEALFAAIREGQDIRIAWGFSIDRDGETLELEHIVEPVFLTAINGEHVAAQLPEHIAQQAYHDIDRALFDDPSVMWRGLMTTRGSFDAVWVNRATGEEVRRYPQRAALSWFGSSAPSLDADTLAVPGGVMRDESR
ncbi:MAG: hypothetical protein AAF311_13115 [Pseudomonadota bacterium]